MVKSEEKTPKVPTIYLFNFLQRKWICNVTIYFM